MKNRTRMFFCLILLVSINTIAQSDSLNKNSMTEPINYLKQIITENKSLNFQIKIINRHNGEYRINARIELGNDKVLITTFTNDMTNSSSEVKLNFSKDKFLEKLEKLLTQVDDFFLLAGHSQNIEIKKDTITNKYFTSNAHGLMFLLEGR